MLRETLCNMLNKSITKSKAKALKNTKSVIDYSLRDVGSSISSTASKGKDEIIKAAKNAGGSVSGLCSNVRAMYQAIKMAKQLVKTGEITYVTEQEQEHIF